ncbi:MAG TPA: SGNH/GDSL hydrolase family protein [Gemmataceae bacterium]|nr:SGNH/GDSL hydrolase family protein [Gemmataceae bacterium]
MDSLARLRPFLIFGRRALIGATAAYIAVSFTLGGTDWARPVFYACLAAWCVLILVGQLRAARFQAGGRLYRSACFLEVIAFNLALTLVLAEWSLRAFAHHTGHSLLLSDALDAYRLRPGQDYGEGLHGNRLGYPGSEFQRDREQGVFRIAALGDSFAVGPAVAFADNYLTLLEKALPRAQVYNFGVSGTGPREYYTILKQDALSYAPDLVLVNVFVGNDITEIMATPRHFDPRQNSLYLLLTRSERLLREKWRRTRDVSPAPLDRLGAGALSEASFRELEGKRMAVCLKAPPADLQKKWQRALTYLGSIIDACRKEGVAVAFVLIPDEFQVNPAVLADALPCSGAALEDLDLDLPQRRLQSFCAERGVPCLDLKPAFAIVSGTYAPRDTHWNARGNHLAAERIIAWITEIYRTRMEADRAD